jgi:sRNA-binding protein
MSIRNEDARLVRAGAVQNSLMEWNSDDAEFTTTTTRRTKIHALLKSLRERYPVIRDYLPLTVGIHQAIIEAHPDYKPWLIRRALANHCRDVHYLNALVKGGPRFDLVGIPCGEITGDQAAHAREKLTTRYQVPKPTPRGSEITNTTPVGDTALALRLKETRPRLTLKRKEGRP